VPSIGLCLMPSTDSWAEMPQTSRKGGDDINDVAKLLAERALVLDMAGPGDGHALANAAELRGVLLENQVKGVLKDQDQPAAMRL
jgi:hypothetical protein